LPCKLLRAALCLPVLQKKEKENIAIIVSVIVIVIEIVIGIERQLVAT
jgi:hypothetical protein